MTSSITTTANTTISTTTPFSTSPFPPLMLMICWHSSSRLSIISISFQLHLIHNTFSKFLLFFYASPTFIINEVSQLMVWGQLIEATVYSDGQWILLCILEI
jgi:hypothetical protein